MKTRITFILLASVTTLFLTMPLWIASYDIVQGEGQTSMSPILEEGDVLFVVHKWAHKPQVGDLIVYYYSNIIDSESSIQIVHRVFFVKDIEGETHYQVTGDAVDTNSFPDHYITEYGFTWIPESAIKGTVMFVIPKIGLLIQVPLWLLAICSFFFLFPPVFLLPKRVLVRIRSFSDKLRTNSKSKHKINDHFGSLKGALIILLAISSGALLSTAMYEKPNDPKIELVNWRVYQTINGTTSVWHYNETFATQTHHTFAGELFENWTYVQFSIKNPYEYSFKASLYLDDQMKSFTYWIIPKGCRLRSVSETTIGFHVEGIYHNLLFYNLKIILRTDKESVTINV